MALCDWCWRRLNPYAEYAYDGLALNPLEVMFVKVKGFQVQGRWASAEMATTYDRWGSAQVSTCCDRRPANASQTCLQDAPQVEHSGGMNMPHYRDR